MSTPPPLHAKLLERFTEVFGPPHRKNDKDFHWGLKSHAHMAAINILVNGGSEAPVVWVFDPHDLADGVISTRITEESHIDEVIQQISERIRRAIRPGG